MTTQKLLYTYGRENQKIHNDQINFWLINDVCKQTRGRKLCNYKPVEIKQKNGPNFFFDSYCLRTFNIYLSVCFINVFLQRANVSGR